MLLFRTPPFHSLKFLNGHLSSLNNIRMNFEREGGECSMSIHKYLYFTLNTRMFTQKKNSLAACIAVPPNFIVGGTRSGTLYRWAIPEKIEDTTLYPSFEVTMHMGLISVLHWSEPHKLLFSGSADRSVLVWQMQNRVPPEKPIQEIRIFEETPVDIVTYMSYLFICEHRGVSVLIQHNVKGADSSHALFQRIHFIKNKNPFKNPFNTICFSPNPTVDNSGYLYIGHQNGSIIQYDAQLTDKPSFNSSNTPKRISENAIFKIIFVPRENVILVFSFDRHIRIFNPRNYRVVVVLHNPNNVDWVSACYEDDTMQYLLADRDGFLYVWEYQEMSRILLTTKFAKNCDDLVAAGNGKFLFLQREGINMIDVNRGTVKTSYQIHNGTVFYINYINDGTKMLVVTAGDDRKICLWDPIDFNNRDSYNVPTHLVILSVHVDVRERPMANLIWGVTGHDEGKLYYHNLSDKKHVELPSKHKNSISSICVVQHEMKVVMLACDYDGIVSTWSIDSILENISYAAVSMIKIWRASDREILACAGRWFVENPTFATGGNDKLVKLWREVDGVYVESPLRGHTDSVTALVFEGFFLISGSEDLTVRIWDTVNLVQLTVIPHLHTHAIRSIVQLDGESKFASSDAGGVIVLYDYVKKKELWKVKHSSDCKCLFVEQSSNRIFACVKSELIPHNIPEPLMSTGLPALRSSSNLSVRY